MLWLYRIAISLGAFLLFLVQPMYAKRLLPSLGGTPAVWNTVMVFFQAALLLGYGYAHLLRKWLPGKSGVLLHVVLLALALLMPVVVRPETIPPPGTLPTILWVLLQLTLGIGIPFLFVSATSPLLQSWFSQTQHRLRNDPYFLYSASNLGSFAALLAYPLLWERQFTMDQQALSWRIGLAVLVGLMALCGWAVRGGTMTSGDDSDVTRDDGDNPNLDRGSPTPWRRVRWVACAAAASSWLLAVTQYITTDLAPVPLLWVVPLSMYLLSFVIVFARKPIIGLSWWSRVLPPAMLVLVTSMMFFGTWQLLVAHLLVFGIGVLACHAKIAADRPDSRYLTEFYFWMSAGGVLGGFFNAILAPILFPAILEYGIAILVAAWFATQRVLPTGSNAGQRYSNSLIGKPWAWSMLSIVVLLFVAMYGLMRFQNNEWIIIGVTVVVPLIVLTWLLDYPQISVTLASIVVLSTHLQSPEGGRTLFTGRSYFGIHRVKHYPYSNRYQLVHGSTMHGIFDADEPNKPLSYYARSSALGKVFDTLPIQRTEKVAAVGLGTGTVATYRENGKRDITVYEIDPMVLELASNENYFGYLKAGGLDASNVRIGDGRLQLQAAKDDRYDILLLDAFSSDAIPMHLMTREAIELYLDRLDEDGLILFHVSNRHLDLTLVLAGLAKEMGLVAYEAYSMPNEEEKLDGISITRYVLLARQEDDVREIVADDIWKRIDPRGGPVWTDDCSNFLDVLSWEWSTRP